MIPFCNLVDIDEMSRVVRERKRTYIFKDCKLEEGW